MPIDVFDLYEELCGAVNTQQGGHVRPHRNFLQWVNQTSLSLFEEKFAVWSKSQKITDDLAKPFLKSINVEVKAVNSSYGVAPFPEQYAHFSAARYVKAGEVVGVPNTSIETIDCCGKAVDLKERPRFISDAVWQVLQAQEIKDNPDPQPAFREITIELISNDRWGSCIDHRLTHPTMSKPKMTQFDEGFKVAPAEVPMIKLDYLRMPKDATFFFTVAPPDALTGRGDYMIYDKDKSTPLEWSMLVKNEFLTRLEKKYGKYIREDFIWQTSEADRKQTV
jgi:hypothetical protein